MIINYAHRGASGYCPENTMAAFQRAVELGATGIETDVQMTADGELVLIHDESLYRTTGVDKLVKDTTLAELQKLDAGAWFSNEFTGERVPTLDQLMELVKREQIMLNIEIKSGVVLYPDIERKVIEKIRQHQLDQQCIISNFNHYSLAQCKAINPYIATGILYMEGLYRPWDYAATVGANALHAPKYAVTAEWVAEAKANGIIYNVWTVNEPQEMKALLAAGVAGIITDYPDRLQSIISGKE
ncbi:glycerophosphoryl diester phosphodiesterase [Paenibacillus montaniterrae]|uniref:Glycerophosphoryl diester phosphodiesterase n=1 Tax=Paenibacillus montaniterrae TaxID=429341 RepID=A0A920CU49_9BACL|nr:glycerophosphodiester phosphodiesterase [Paenibacillus montaniterrae]GIP16627.1 glycerophosphoryl diester phosphodiesterase [Paenibacillus montaniterrae]